jgi:hypothetical protein
MKLNNAMFNLYPQTFKNSTQPYFFKPEKPNGEFKSKNKMFKHVVMDRYVHFWMNYVISSTCGFITPMIAAMSRLS